MGVYGVRMASPVVGKGCRVNDFIIIFVRLQVEDNIFKMLLPNFTQTFFDAVPTTTCVGTVLKKLG